MSVERSPRLQRVAISALLFLVVCCVADLAQARGIIKEPRNHPHYSLALEPLLVFGLSNPPGLPYLGGYGVDDGIGPGLRLTFPILDRGFLPKVNDTVALGFGAEWVYYAPNNNYARGYCTHFVPGPNGTDVCTEVDGYGSAHYLFLPAVMQWNFWLHKKWSVFGEPGLALYFDRPRDATNWGVSPVLQVGGRWHFADSLQLVLRIGYPTSSIGLSWFL